MIFIQKRQVLPLPLIAQCGRLGVQFSKPQVPGKTTLHALSFDPSKFQFLAQFSCFPMPSKHERCVRGYGISTITYTRFVSGYGISTVTYTHSVLEFPEGKLHTVHDFSKGQLRTLCEVEKDCIG